MLLQGYAQSAETSASLRWPLSLTFALAAACLGMLQPPAIVMVTAGQYPT